jgi:RNA polymerase sigma-70 factor (ECF subfamily)
LAEDASQEVFIQLWRKIANYDGNSQFSTWLHSVTANVTISYMRKQRSWFQRMLNIETSGITEPAAPQEISDNDLDTHIRALPERARLVFVLYAIEGYRHEEIANMLNMAVGSSKAQLHRARGLLKHAMGCNDE